MSGEGKNMSFFAKHASFSGGSYPVADAGAYKCTLIDVEQTDRPSFEDRDRLEPNFRWIFETVEVGDEEGRPFRFTQFTKTAYGYDAAKLTKLLDGMLGRRLTPQEFAGLDLDELKAASWSVTVDTVMSAKGREVNTIQSVKPWKAPVRKPLRKPVVDETDGIEDPFAE